MPSVASTDSQDASLPSSSPDPSSSPAQYTGPHPYVYSPSFQTFYAREAAQVRKEKPGIGEEKLMKAVQERWEQQGKGKGKKRNRRRRKRDPEGDGKERASQIEPLTTANSSSTLLKSAPPAPPKPASLFTSLMAPFAFLVGLSLLSPAEDTPLPDVKLSKKGAEPNPPEKKKTRRRRRRRPGRSLSKEQKKVKYDKRRYAEYLKREKKRLKKAAAAAAKA